jgi:parvulin-like peptidyl-prolyl isomerase
MLPAELDGNATDVARSFGEEFELELRMLPVGSWQGPVRSGFGLHLVRIDERRDGRPAELSEVRAEVARDLTHARAQAASETYYERLRSKYVVRIEDGATTPAG